MAYVTKKLGDLCMVMTGAPMSRAKKIAPGETGPEVKVLIPRAMENGRIVDGEIVRETVSKVKGDLFTRAGDVIVKASTPYDCVYIDASHEGILVTSFGLILRKGEKGAVDMRYLAMYLNQPQTRRKLQDMAVGETLQLIRKAAIEGFGVPLVSQASQDRLAALYENVLVRKEQCLKMIAAGEDLIETEFSRTVFD